jgi:pimeloyl-ACP methyl ester carboxylesterase
MMSSSGYQHINGLRLYVHRTRDPEAPPSGLTIVLVHGFLDSGATWDMVAPQLARAGHDVVAPDLRGFGLSDSIGAGGYYHFPDYVADLAELVDSLAPRRLAVVGHSMGGTIAALYAGAHPDRLERLALLEGLGPMATEPSVAVDRMQAWLRTMREVPRVPKTLSSLQEVVERLSLHHPRVPREVIESRARLLTRVDDAGRLLWAYDPLHRTTAPTPFAVDAFKEFLRRVDCPTLVVSGGPVGWHPPDEAQRIVCLKHVVQAELPTAGHMMHWTEPNALAAHLVQFLGEPPPQKRAPHSAARGSAAAQVSVAPVSAGRVAAPPVSAGPVPSQGPVPSYAPVPSQGPVPSYGPVPSQGPAQAAGITAPGAPPSWAGMAPAVAPMMAPAVAPMMAPAVAPMMAPAVAPVVGPAMAPPAPVPPAVTAAGIGGVTAPARPIFGGAAADISMPVGPAAGAVPAGPTRPSSGNPHGGGEGGATGGNG